MEALDGIRLGVVKYTIDDVQDRDGWFDITTSLSTPSDSTEHHYYVVPHEDSYVLASPLYVHTRDWKTRESKYCRLIYTDSTLINSHAIDELDRFIAKTCYLLNIPLTRRRQIESEKIDYYLCTQEQIKLLTGYDIQGVTHLPLDAVVTRQLPHKHELSHLLINFRLGQLPLYTLPVMQEGFATAVGGRWGKDRRVLLQLGNILIENDFGTVDDVLTHDGFRYETGSPDISYSIACIFADMILSEFSIEPFLDAYVAVSGTNAEIQRLNRDEIKSRISGACSKSWPELSEVFEIHRHNIDYYSLLPTDSSAPGDSTFELVSPACSVKIRDGEEVYQFTVESTSDNPRGVILLTPDVSNMEKEYRSWMFAEHLPGQTYDGERFGIVFSPGEVGFYDYFTNFLLAKYVYSLEPFDGYLSSDGRIISFIIPKELIPDRLDAYRLLLH